MKSIILICLICSMLLISCSIHKKEPFKDKTSFREIAIDEFVKTNLFKKDKVYSIDSLFLEDSGMVYIGIIESGIKIFAFEDETEKIPQSIEVKNALFMWKWKDNNFDVQKSISLLKKYNMLYDDTDENYFSFEPDIDDSVKSLKLFFCRDNKSIYKKIKTNMPIQYYNIPKLKCR